MFYHAVWDPLLICSQMLCLQCCLYLLAGGWLTLFSFTFGIPLSLHALLSPAHMQTSRGGGWSVIAAYALQAPVLAYALLRTVGRAKQCMDFTLTLYVIHAAICTLYEGAWPRGWEWWTVNIAGQQATRQQMKEKH